MHHKSLLRVLAAATIILSLSVPEAHAESAPTNQGNARNFYFPSTDVTVKGQAILLVIDDYLLPVREYGDLSFDPSLSQGAGPDAGIKPLPHYPISGKAH